MFLRQSTASQEILIGPFVDSTDGSTAETALTINNTDIKIWKHGATTEANKNSGGATHIASGRYYAVLDATDTNTVGQLEINVAVAGALPVRRSYMVVEEAIYDMLFAGSANGDSAGIATLLTRIGSSLTINSGRVDANVTHFNGTAGTFSSGRPEVNSSHWGGTAVGSALVRSDVIQISGDATAANNAESFFDGTGYAGTNNVIPTVTNVTNAVTATDISAVKAVTDKLDSSLELDGAVYRFTSNALEQAPIGTSLDAAGVRAAIGMAAANLDTQLTGIQTGVTNISSSTGSTLTAIPWNPAWDAEVQSECADALTAYAPLTTLGTNAPANWINATSIAASALNGKGDWNIGKTGYALSSSQTFSLTGNITGNLSGSVGSVTSPVTAGTVSDKTGYSLAVTPPTTAQIADAVWDEDNRGHTSPHSTGKNLDTVRKANYVIDGTVAAGGTPTTTVFRTTLTQLDSTYDHQTLLFLTGNLGGQSKPILSYSQADGVITLDEALTEVPIAGDEFVILPHHVHPLSIIISRILAAEIESGGYDLKRTLQAVGAMLAGLVSGAGSGTESFKAIGTPAKTRVQFVVDANGNRTGVTYDWS